MKPTIRPIPNAEPACRWVCFVPGKPQLWGYGPTPRAAYVAWSGAVQLGPLSVPNTAQPLPSV